MWAVWIWIMAIQLESPKTFDTQLRIWIKSSQAQRCIRKSPIPILYGTEWIKLSMWGTIQMTVSNAIDGYTLHCWSVSIVPFHRRAFLPLAPTPHSDMENKWYRVLCTEKVNIFLWNVEKYECMSHGGAIEHRHCLQKWEREKNKLNKQTCGNSSRQGACCNLQTARDSHGRFSYTVIVPVLPKCSGCRLLLHLMTLCHGSVPKSGKQRARETWRTKKKRKKKINRE